MVLVELQPLPFGPDANLTDIQRAVFNYWNSKRQDRFAPGRRDLDPVDLAAYLSGVILFEVERSGQEIRFRYRLSGTSTTKLHGAEFTGKYTDELTPKDFADGVTDGLRRVVTEKRPYRALWSLAVEERRKLEYQVLRLPLSEDGENVDMILTVADYRGRDLHESLNLVKAGRLSERGGGGLGPLGDAVD